jgi:L-asparaginase/Glu-tRNA(Gln) amidotransferase subunit D
MPTAAAPLPRIRLLATGGTIANAGITNGTTCNDDGGLTGCATGLQSQVFARLDADFDDLVPASKGGASTLADGRAHA